MYFYAASPVEIGNLRSTSTIVKRLKMDPILSISMVRALKRLKRWHLWELKVACGWYFSIFRVFKT
jgi:hypothetical protein